MPRVDIEITCSSLEEAEERRRSILQDYHPYAYGTSLTIHPPSEGGNLYLLKGHRFDSAD